MMTLANVRELVLALALFFNPFGYNELFAATMKLTHSYWTTSCIFYGVASVLFGVYLALRYPMKFPMRMFHRVKKD